ncbi:MAG TPA: hypothetical protein ENH23_00850 [candidate division Zixibacteria bacterium]|nr:hypothetical protein [candidate division Zixibacteria bacterium]
MEPQYKVLFHIDKFDIEGLNIAFKNANNLITDKGASSVQIALVVNYLAPKLFLKNTLGKEMTDNLAKLIKSKNASIFICNNSLKNLKISREELLTFCKVVPAGITKIIELQNDGFAYVKP